jgi:hypothetical protein
VLWLWDLELYCDKILRGKVFGEGDDGLAWIEGGRFNSLQIELAS